MSDFLDRLDHAHPTGEPCAECASLTGPNPAVPSREPSTARALPAAERFASRAPDAGVQTLTPQIEAQEPADSAVEHFSRSPLGATDALKLFTTREEREMRRAAGGHELDYSDPVLGVPAAETCADCGHVFGRWSRVHGAGAKPCAGSWSTVRAKAKAEAGTEPVVERYFVDGTGRRLFVTAIDVKATGDLQVRGVLTWPEPHERCGEVRQYATSIPIFERVWRLA